MPSSVRCGGEVMTRSYLPMDSKRGYNGVYHNFSRKHLSKYINEFSFRLNEGNVRVDTQDRLDSLFSAMQGKTITYKELIAG